MRQRRDQDVRQGLPGASRDITSAKLTRQLIEIFARLVLALAQSQLQRSAITRRFRNLSGQSLDQLLHPAACTVARKTFQTVIHILASSPIDDRSGLF